MSPIIDIAVIHESAKWVHPSTSPGPPSHLFSLPVLSPASVPIPPFRPIPSSSLVIVPIMHIERFYALYYFLFLVLLWLGCFVCNNKRIRSPTGSQELRQWMRIYLKKISTKFHPDLTWNNGAPWAFPMRSPHATTTTTTTRWVAIWDKFLI